MNEEFNRLRATLARCYPDKGEIMRSEITIILIMIKMEVRKWAGNSKSDRLPLYRRGAIFEQVGIDSEEVARYVVQYMEEFDLSDDDLAALQ